ncbi:MAG: hypothetical protein EOO01_09805 [Chitinophagaceae bacterium]|nr:MAG: hypothetical protein EOO01_09805 [Chitinophagaceae bacterium]
MKWRLITCICAVVTFTACNSGNEDIEGRTEGKHKKKSERNLTITPSNSYSDLFLDSNDVEKFIIDQKVSEEQATDLRRFYNFRNFQFAWFSKDGLTEQTLSFRTLYDYDKDSGVSRKNLDNTLDDLLNNDSLQKIDASARIKKTELMLSWRYVNYLDGKYAAGEERQLALASLVPSKKAPLMQAAEMVMKESWNEPKEYRDLKAALKRYVEIVKAGGFPTVPSPEKSYKPGASNDNIKLIKKRMAAEGFFPANDTTPEFNKALAEAVKSSQARYGLKDDGVIGKSWVSELNVPAERRVEQILINLERMKWMPEAPEGRLILVNIPEFRMHIFDNKSKEFHMDIVVGKEGNSTINFSGSLNQVVFNPYWNVPRSIVAKEVLPGMEKNPAYLEEHHMEITGEEGGMPVVRQIPGDHNALGQVKFLFPNSFNIYFHDTPEKELFKKTKRAYSHGCIRLSEPMKLAQYLLEDTDWDQGKVDNTTNEI